MFKIRFFTKTTDPLEEMLVDKPLELITKGADAGCHDVAHYVYDQAIGDSPWESGTLTNAHEVWKPRTIPKTRRAKGVVAQRRVGMSSRDFDGGFYPVALEFGWHPHGTADFVGEEHRWLRDALLTSRGAALGIHRRAMARTLKAEPDVRPPS